MPVEKTIITINDEKKTLKRREITSACIESMNVKASKKSPNRAAQKMTLSSTTSATRSRACVSIVPTRWPAVVVRSHSSSRLSCSIDSGWVAAVGGLSVDIIRHPPVLSLAEWCGGR